MSSNLNKKKSETYCVPASVAVLLKTLQQKVATLWKSSKYFRIISVVIPCSLSCILLRRIYIKVYRNHYSYPPGPYGVPVFGSFFSFVLGPTKFLTSNYNYGAISSFYLGTQLIISINNGIIGHDIHQKEVTKVMNRPLGTLIESLPNKYVSICNGIQYKKRRKLGMVKLINVSKLDVTFHAIKYAINNGVCPAIDVCIGENKLFYPNKYMFYITFNTMWSTIFGGYIDIKNSIVFTWYQHIKNMFNSFMPLFILQLCGINSFPPHLYNKLMPSNFNFKNTIRILEHDVEAFMVNEGNGDFELDENNLWKRKTKTNIDNNNINHMNDSPFIDAAIAYQHEEKWFDKQMLLNDVSGYFMAGTDTTTKTAEFGLLLLAKFPNIQDEIYNELINVLNKNNQKEFTFSIFCELHKLKAFIHETIRIACLGPLGLARVIEEDIEYEINEKKYILPKGSLLILNHILIHKYSWNNTSYPDEQVNLKYWFDENNKFKINEQFIAFGSSKRACMGKATAMKALYILFPMLMMKYRFVNPNPDTIMDIKQKFGPIVTVDPPIGIKVVARQKRL